MILNMSMKPTLPKYSTIKAQLTPLRWYETAATVAIPIGTMIAYFVFAHYQLYVLAFVAVFYLSFVTYGSCSHDLVHANCGLRRRTSYFWLSIIELGMLRSGTVYRLVHLNHHHHYPNFELDPEGRASYFSLFRTLIEGPIFQFRLLFWALSNYPAKRPLIVLETLLCIVFFAIGIALWTSLPQILIYQILVITGSWVIPFITSYLVHLPHEPHPIRQTRLYRGIFFRVMALDHLYHLEHHLYPMVPHYRWTQLATILNPYFEAANLAVTSIPEHRPEQYNLN